MNAEDGSWRFIYVGPNGQLIGSLRQTNLLQNALNMPAASALSAFGGGMQMPALPGSAAAQKQAPGGPGVGMPVAGAPGISAPGQNTNPAAAANPLESQPQGLDGEVLGGNIIGVGSKVNQKSIIWYDKAKNYRQFEFIWDPSKEPVNGGANAGVVGIPGQVPQNGGTSLFGGASGTSGFGQQPGGTMTGNPGPGQTGSPDQPPGTQPPTPQSPAPQQ